MHLRFLFGLIAAVLLSSLGNPRARAGEVVSHPVRIACIGDSITFGLGLASVDDTYPAQLQLLLGPGYAVKNFGRSGCTVTRETFSGWPRGYIKQDVCAEALRFQPDIVICNLGINDVSGFADPQRPMFERDYREIIAAFRALPSKPRIILWHPLSPLFPGHPYHGHPVVQELNARTARVAAETKAETIDLHAPLDGHPEWFARDSIHPNAEGARRIAEITRDYLSAHPVHDGSEKRD